MQQRTEDWEAAVVAVLEEVRGFHHRGATAGRTTVSAGQPFALAVTGQMQDLILLDAAGEPTHPVILYSDTAAEPELADLLTARPDWAARLLLAPGPDAIPPKLLRLAHTVPEALREAERVLFSASGWLCFALTGRAVCDRLTASTTSAYFVRTRDWFPFGPAFDSLEFPMLTEPGGVGRVTAAAARRFGLPEGLPVVTALGDAGAATDGMVGGAPGSLYLHLGTTGWVAHIDPVPAEALPLPSETGRPGTHHRLAHPSGHLALARLPEAGEALERARRVHLGLAEPHSAEAHAAAEAALARALRAENAAADAGTGAAPDMNVSAAQHADPDRTRPVSPAPASDPGSDMGPDPASDPVPAPAEEHQPAASEGDRAYLAAVRSLAAEVRELLLRLGARPERLPATGGVVRSALVRRVLAEELGIPVELIPEAEAGLRSCARTAFDAFGLPHTIAPLVC